MGTGQMSSVEGIERQSPVYLTCPLPEHRRIADSKPLTLQGSDYAHAVFRSWTRRLIGLKECWFVIVLSRGQRVSR